MTHYSNGNHVRQVLYGMTSFSPEQTNPTRLLHLNRNYWAIESYLHYRRNATLHEDATRLSVSSAGQFMAILNNLVIRLALNQDKGNLPKAMRAFDAKPATALKKICSHPSTL